MTPEGFEPPTNGAEIRHSIQLNYGAEMKLEFRSKNYTLFIFLLLFLNYAKSFLTIVEIVFPSALPANSLDAIPIT